MLSWDEAHTAYLPDLINHYEIGKTVGFVDGALAAYTDIKTAISLEPAPTIPELQEILNKTIASYEAPMEEE